MRAVRLIIVLVAALASTAFAASSAFAAETLWQWLPGAEKTAFTGKSGEATLETVGGSTIKCKKSESKSGEITTEKTLGLVIVWFLGCSAFGFPTNSLGDKEGEILVHVELHNCLIAAGHPGILFLLLPVHLEVTFFGLIDVRGSFVALISPNKKSTKEYTLTITQSKGKQSIEKCEGGKKDTLEASTNGGAFEESGEEAKEGKVTFTSVAQEAMA